MTQWPSHILNTPISPDEQAEFDEFFEQLNEKTPQNLDTFGPKGPSEAHALALFRSMKGHFTEEYMAAQRNLFKQYLQKNVKGGSRRKRNTRKRRKSRSFRR